MNLVFADGTTVSVHDGSVAENIIIEPASFAEVDTLKLACTAENLTGATLGETKLMNLVPQSITASTNGDGTITVHLISRELTAVELNQMQITELQEALAEIAG